MKTKIINYPDLMKALNRQKTPNKFDVLKLDSFSELSQLVKGKKYFIRTYGCQANVRDEETMRGMLENVGYISANEPEEADLIIINTCAVRENAEDKVYGEIGNLKYLRKKNKGMILAICGCMVEQPEILNRLMSTFPEVNLYFGTHEIGKLYSLIYEVISSKDRVVSIESKQGFKVYPAGYVDEESAKKKETVNKMMQFLSVFCRNSSVLNVVVPNSAKGANNKAKMFKLPNFNNNFE